MSKRQRISLALFDVKPVTKRGDLDVEKIRQVGRILDLREMEIKGKSEQESPDIKSGSRPEGVGKKPVEESLIEEDLNREKIMTELVNEMEALESLPEEKPKKEEFQITEDFYFPEVVAKDYLKPVVKPKKPPFSIKDYPKSITSFLIIGFLVALMIPTAAWLSRGLEVKDEVLGSSLSAYQNLLAAKESLEGADFEAAERNISAVRSDLLAIREGIGSIPLAKEMLEEVLGYSEDFLEILGHSNPRQYLLVFQNNSETRATGGFIGTYGLLELDRGEITNLFIDGIFNADGQLHEKIIPPRPIQKVSTAWSMHDSNWFADFPTSAEKITWFYEKTGGPTVDGVISLTPTVFERLLEITGPISMPEYNVVLTPENFVELIQYKVEIDYDKELNRPKKILGDFTPKFIEKLGELSSQDKKKAMEIIFDALGEKHILAYFRDQSLETLAINEGWAGELKKTDRDYLSVVSSNINGFKTDRVVKESINHLSEIQEDGSIINTLTITREHQGGQTDYDWWNRVNANYLRVYLPLGSELVSAKGQTVEVYHPPIDYDQQGFKRDPLVNSIENNMVIDQRTGTHIFEENGKTVFGNWAYVSPGKTVVLTYRYRLPFKIDLTKSTDSYSLLIQKQLGSLGSQFSHQLKFPEDWQISWQYPQEIDYQNYLTDLKTDRFLGITFEF